MPNEESARQMVEQAFTDPPSTQTLRAIMSTSSYQTLSRGVASAVEGHEPREILTLVAALLTSMTPYETDHQGAVPIIRRAVQVTDGLIRDDGMRAPELLLFMAAILSGLAINAPPQS